MRTPAIGAHPNLKAAKGWIEKLCCRDLCSNGNCLAVGQPAVNLVNREEQESKKCVSCVAHRWVPLRTDLDSEEGRVGEPIFVVRVQDARVGRHLIQQQNEGDLV